MRAWLLAGMFGLLATPAPAAGVLSLNLCTDQLLLALAGPDEITGVSILARDCSLSAECRRAEAVPTVRGTAEEVVALHPRLVLAGPSGAAAAQAVARRLGIPVLSLGDPRDFSAIRAQIGQVADALGHHDRGAELASALDRRLEAVPPPDPEHRPTAAVYEPNGFTAGSGSLADAVMARAGLANWATRDRGTGAIPLERLLADPPDVLITGPREANPSLAQAMLWHPALMARFDGRRVEVPGRDWICGSPATLEALEILVRARRSLKP